MAHYYAYCFRDGVVGFSQMLSTVPEGALIFAEGEGRTFKNTVETRCRLAYNGRTYLCPGLPEGDLNGFKGVDWLITAALIFALVCRRVT